jgi:hypothetical protein
VVSARVLAACSLLHAVAAQDEDCRESAHRAVTLARRAADEARREPLPELHAMIASRHAVAASLLGDKPAFSSAISRAQRELRRRRRHGGGSLPSWLHDFGDGLILSAEATGLLNLGETGRAVALYREALRLAVCPRDLLASATALTHALVVHGERDDAAAVALDVALPLTEKGVTSVRCMRQLRHVSAEVTAHPRARELRERLEAARPPSAEVRTCTGTPAVAVLACQPHRLSGPQNDDHR